MKNKNTIIKNKNIRCAKQHENIYFTVLTYANMNIKKNMTRLWCKIVPKTSVEHVERNEGSYFYLYAFGDITQKNFQGGLCVL